jgi:hypothetical protein
VQQLATPLRASALLLDRTGPRLDTCEHRPVPLGHRTDGSGSRPEGQASADGDTTTVGYTQQRRPSQMPFDIGGFGNAKVGRAVAKLP